MVPFLGVFVFGGFIYYTTSGDIMKIININGMDYGR